MSSTPDIFLSYTRDDQDIARRFAQAFEREGFTVWWDQTLRSGEDYDRVTECPFASKAAPGFAPNSAPYNIPTVIGNHACEA